MPDLVIVALLRCKGEIATAGYKFPKEAKGDTRGAGFVSVNFPSPSYVLLFFIPHPIIVIIGRHSAKELGLILTLKVSGRPVYKTQIDAILFPCYFVTQS